MNKIKMETEKEIKNTSTTDIYDGQFRGNILVLGRTDSGKTYYIQQLALNGILGNIEKTPWVSGVATSDTRKAQIQSCFANDIEFYDISSYEDLNELINYFKEINEDTDEIIDDDSVNNKNFLGEKKKLNNLIVIDDVSGLADNSKSTFADFLTISRKYRYNVIYAFHSIKTNKEVWSKIISQTTIFNIFPKSTPIASVFRILQDNCSRKEEKEKENFKVGVELKKQDYIDQLNKFLLENQPAIDDVRQKKSEDRERILLDIENPHIKIEDEIDPQDTQNNQVVDEKLLAISYITSETTPEAPEFSIDNIIAPAVKNENVDGINSNSNLISDSDDVIIIDDDDNDGTQGGIIHISPVDDEELIDIDQKDGEKIKIEVKKESELDDDGDIDFSIKREETEEGFIRDIPNRDNLGEQIFIDLTQDDSDDDDEDKLKDDPEMNTDFQRLVPASQALNILREQEQNETKLEKVNDQGNTLAAVKYKPKRKQKNDLEVIEFKPKKTKKISRRYL